MADIGELKGKVTIDSSEAIANLEKMISLTRTLNRAMFWQRLWIFALGMLCGSGAGFLLGRLA